MYYEYYEEIVQLGELYIRPFIEDYHRFITDTRIVISPDQFAKEWTCLPPGSVSRANPGLHLYYKTGNKFSLIEVIANSTHINLNQGTTVHYVSAHFVPPHSMSSDDFYIEMGSLYSLDRVSAHDTETCKRIYSFGFNVLPENQGGGKLWPTKLITTKTKEP